MQSAVFMIRAATTVTQFVSMIVLFSANVVTEYVAMNERVMAYKDTY